MVPTNDFLPFCSTDTGSNLLTQVEYAADPQTVIGNQPGVARSKLVNKAVRQATYMAACVAQFLANQSGDNVLDDENEANVLTTMGKTFQTAPTIQKFTATGAGTYTLPTTPRKPLYIRVRMVGGGGGGAGSSGAGDGGTGGTGGVSFFRVGASPNLLVANGGVGGVGGQIGGIGGAGGTASLGTGPIGTAFAGASGEGGSNNGTLETSKGGTGAASFFGGNGPGGVGSVAGSAAIANTGSGGGGGGGLVAGYAGCGGGAGGFVEAIITAPANTYAFSVGAAGTAGAAGTGGSTPSAGGAGGAGYIEVTEYYQ
jgi:hypothetical protein